MSKFAERSTLVTAEPLPVLKAIVPHACWAALDVRIITANNCGFIFLNVSVAGFILRTFCQINP